MIRSLDISRTHRHKFYLSGFVNDFLDRRHRLRMDPLSCPKQSSLLKLILNGELFWKVLLPTAVTRISFKEFTGSRRWSPRTTTASSS